MECSVIVSSHLENPEFFLQSITSILNQTDVEIEFIVSMVEGDENISLVPPGVTIHTIPKSKHVGHSPEGSFQQINVAIPLVTKKYFRWFSGDDILFPQTTKLQIEKLESSGKLVCHSGVEYFKNGKTKRRDAIPYNREIHQTRNMVPDTSIMNSKLLSLAPLNYKKFGNYAFWDFWLRVYEKYGKVFTRVRDIGWMYRIHEDSTHVKRKRDPKAFKKYFKDKDDMLKYHPL